jgi:hypothetical protein
MRSVSDELARIVLTLGEAVDGGVDGLVDDYRFLCETIVLPEELHFRRHGSYRLSKFADADCQEVGRRLNNRVENSHQSSRRRERAMPRFRKMKTLQKFSSVHAKVHNHLDEERHLISRERYKERRSAAPAE